jgi:hypothetical protein
MLINKPEPAKIQDAASRSQQALDWAMCHPGILLLSSLAAGTMLAWQREKNQQTTTERRVETEADIIDGDIPLFI